MPFTRRDELICFDRVGMDHSRIDIDWGRFAQNRQHLGGNFLRQMGYFREDGIKSVSAIEQAMRDRNAVALVGPADQLKSDAMQMGAQGVAELAEDIEFGARDCVEWHQQPDMLIEPVLKLRAAFEATVDEMDARVNPLLQRKFA